MNADELRALAERVQGLDGPDRGVDADILQTLADDRWEKLYHEAQLPCGCPHDMAVERARELAGCRYRFTASLDAAMTLVPSAGGFSLEHERPTRQAIASVANAGGEPFDGKASVAEAATPALALTAAALLARAEQE